MNGDKWFMPTVVDGQAIFKMEPGENQCLSLTVPPILGGELEPDNIKITDVAVHFSIAGQILRQVRDLAPGTRIADLKIDGMPNSKNHQNKRWWRFW